MNKNLTRKNNFLIQFSSSSHYDHIGTYSTLCTWSVLVLHGFGDTTLISFSFAFLK